MYFHHEIQVIPISAFLASISQAFVDELVDIGKVGWLEEYYTSDDKKALIAKVWPSHVP